MNVEPLDNTNVSKHLAIIHGFSIFPDRFFLLLFQCGLLRKYFIGI